MSRVLGVVIVAALCAGCRNPTPVYDPFMGRTTVPPPGTATPPPGQPYYAPPTVAPGTPGAPPLIQAPMNGASAIPPSNGLSSSFTPNVSTISQTSAVAPPPATMAVPPVRAVPNTFPATPNAQPLNSAPNMVQPSYGPPGGGMNYPPAAFAPPAAGTPTLAQAPGQPITSTGVPTLANPATAPGAVKSATWEATDASKAASSTTPVVFNSSQDKNPIRIVAPPPGAASTASAAKSTNSSPTLAASTLNQSLSSARVPELNDLPPANTGVKVMAAAASPSASNAATSAAAPAAAAATSQSDTAGYGYDPQYRWLKGKLEYSQSTRSWRLRYIPPDGNTDNYGGSVVLANNAQLSGLQAGDAVYAQGSMGAGSASQASFAPQYNLQQIQKL